MVANQTQQDHWTSPAGLKWVEHERALDAAMAGMLPLMPDAAAIRQTDRVLDIGCGTGASTLAAARLGGRGLSVGVDIAEFLLSDAQTHRFPPSSFGVMISRIGMSFLADTEAAPANLKAALAEGGRMALVCWGAADLNLWFLIPRQATEARLGALAEGDPRAPGPTAFEDIDHVTGMTPRAVLSGVAARQVEVILTPPEGVRGADRQPGRPGGARHEGPQRQPRRRRSDRRRGPARVHPVRKRGNGRRPGGREPVSVPDLRQAERPPRFGAGGCEDPDPRNCCVLGSAGEDAVESLA